MSPQGAPSIILTFDTEWRGVKITVTYEANWLNMETDYGHITAHLQIQGATREALPITETGYRSQFLGADEVEVAGGPVAFVIAWLEEAAQSPGWIRREITVRQLSLF